MPVSALFLPDVQEEAVPWVHAEADPDELLFDDEDLEEEDWEDLDEPDELEFGDDEDWDDEDLEEEFEGYVAEDDGEDDPGW